MCVCNNCDKHFNIIYDLLYHIYTYIILVIDHNDIYNKAKLKKWSYRPLREDSQYNIYLLWFSI